MCMGGDNNDQRYSFRCHAIFQNRLCFRCASVAKYVSISEQAIAQTEKKPNLLVGVNQRKISDAIKTIAAHIATTILGHKTFLIVINDTRLDH